MDLTFKKSALKTGGVISGIAYNSPLAFEDLFKSPTPYEMKDGVTDYVKVFAHFFGSDDANNFVKRIKPSLIKQSLGDDRILWGFGTKNDTTLNMGVARWYGSGILETSVTATSTVVKVTVKSVGDALFLPNDAIVLDNGFRMVTAKISSLSYTGNVASLTLTEQLGSDFTYGVTTVAVMTEILEQKATCSKVSKISLNGDFDATKVVLNPKGTVSNRVTLTFQSSTGFFATSDDFSLGVSGYTSTSFSPNNPATSTPYFTIPSNAFVGVFQAGDQVVLEFVGNYTPIWFKRVVPPNSAGYANNGFSLRVEFSPEITITS